MTHEEKLNIALQQVKELKNKAKKYLRDSRKVEETVYKIMNEGKPREKPNIGDVAKLWDHDEYNFVVGKIYKTNENNMYRYVASTGNFYQNAKTISRQEAIDLLFGKESD